MGCAAAACVWVFDLNMWHVTNLTTTHRFEQDSPIQPAASHLYVWACQLLFFRLPLLPPYRLPSCLWVKLYGWVVLFCMHCFIFWVKFSNFITTNIRFISFVYFFLRDSLLVFSLVCLRYTITTWWKYDLYLVCWLVAKGSLIYVHMIYIKRTHRKIGALHRALK